MISERKLLADIDQAIGWMNDMEAAPADFAADVQEVMSLASDVRKVLQDARDYLTTSEDEIEEERDRMRARLRDYTGDLRDFWKNNF